MGPHWKFIPEALVAVALLGKLRLPEGRLQVGEQGERHGVLLP